MLASTMQISNNKPGPTHSAAKPDPHRNQDGTDTSQPKRKNNQTPPHKTGRDLPVPSGPNSAPTTTTNHPDPFHPHNPQRGHEEY